MVFFLVDNIVMKISMVSLCLNVISDGRVIFITILSLIAISLANYVVSYRKRPPRPKKAKTVPAPKPAEVKKEEPAEEAE